MRSRPNARATTRASRANNLQVQETFMSRSDVVYRVVIDARADSRKMTITTLRAEQMDASLVSHLDKRCGTMPVLYGRRC